MKNQPRYESIEWIIIDLFDRKNRALCLSLLRENQSLFLVAPGSSSNHQAWPGGYLDHIRDGMNLMIVLYNTLSELRPLLFSLADALLVFFLHDLEKPWKYASSTAHGQISVLVTKEQRHEFRLYKIAEYGIILTSEQLNAIGYIEGEGNDYNSSSRVMNELAAFCHMIDVASARLWHDYPKGRTDTWAGASRSFDLSALVG